MKWLSEPVALTSNYCFKAAISDLLSTNYIKQLSTKTKIEKQNKKVLGNAYK